jgi:hypothetical protein
MMRDNLVLGSLSFILIGAIAFQLLRWLEARTRRQKLKPPGSTVI